MATTDPLSGLTALGAAPATNDLLVLVDVSDPTQAPSGTTKNMTVANLFTSPSITGAVLTGPAYQATVGGGGAAGQVLIKNDDASHNYAIGNDGTVHGTSFIIFDNTLSLTRLTIDVTGMTTSAQGVTAGVAQSGSGAKLNVGDGTAMQPTFGFGTPGTIVGLDSATTLSNATGVYLHSHLLTKQTVATTGSIQGLETWTWAANTTGTVVSLLGLIGNNSVSGGGTTTTSISVAGGGVVSGGSTVTSFYGVRGGGVTVDGVSSVVTSMYALHAIHGTAQNSGTIGTQYGLYVDDLTQATTNYAIFLAGKNDAVFNGSGAALATNAVIGFPYLPTCAGIPTGTPTNVATGRAPVVIDSTNIRIWVYVTGAWHFVALT